MPIEQNDNEEIITLKNIINDLLYKINSLTPILNQYQNSKIYNNSKLGISNNSLYLFGNNSTKDLKKIDLEDDIENKKIIYRNKILELENSTLLFRIKSLEKKLSIYGNNNYNNEEDENDIEDFDADMENNNMEEEKYINNNDYNNFLRNDIKNYNSNEYKYIYKNEKTNKYLNNDKNDNINFNKNININEIPELYQEKNDDNFEYNMNFNDEK